MKSFYDVGQEAGAVARACWLNRIYPRLVELVMNDHIQADALWGVHGLVHTVAVAQYAGIITKDTDARIRILAGVAAICHNTDRLFPDKEEEKLAQYLDETDLTSEERRIVILALENHSKRNDPEDSSVCIILKDADRLGGIGPIGLIRAAQQGREFPLADLFLWDANPDAKFSNPSSLARNVKMLLEWDDENWLRTPKAKEIAAKHFQFLRNFQKMAREQFEEIELFPLSA